MLGTHCGQGMAMTACLSFQLQSLARGGGCAHVTAQPQQGGEEESDVTQCLKVLQKRCISNIYIGKRVMRMKDGGRGISGAVEYQSIIQSINQSINQDSNYIGEIQTGTKSYNQRQR